MFFQRNMDLPPSAMEEAQSPSEFPEPIIDNCTRITARVYHPSRGSVMRVTNVLVPTQRMANVRPHSKAKKPPPATKLTEVKEDDDSLSSCSDSSSSSSSSDDSDIAMEDENDVPLTKKQPQQSSDKAYWLRRTLRKAIYGRVCHGSVLRRAPVGETTYEWVMTEEECAVKELSWGIIRKGRSRRMAENPLQEIAAMQYLQNFYCNSNWQDTHLLTPKDILSDTTYLYMVLPFCSGGELFSEVQGRNNFSEEESRYYFKQILVGVSHLQQAGVCHRDMSLENCLLHRSSRTLAVIIDFGMCLKIPYRTRTANTQNASVATLNLPQDLPTRDIVDYRTEERCWIVPSGTMGKWYYMSPEIVANNIFDGYAIDIWACGVMLFLMATGFPPWERASAATDERFEYMSSGFTMQMLTEWNLGLSEDIKDLFMRMFWIDPHDRLCLAQILQHPWMTNQQLGEQHTSTQNNDTNEDSVTNMETSSTI